MNFQELDGWLDKLSEPDRKYLEKQKAWKNTYMKARASGILPQGFVEKTMEILEGGSESET